MYAREHGWPKLGSTPPRGLVHPRVVGPHHHPFMKKCTNPSEGGLQYGTIWQARHVTTPAEDNVFMHNGDD